jgi:putative peptidoglycan lipid II flippase
MNATPEIEAADSAPRVARRAGQPELPEESPAPLAAVMKIKGPNAVEGAASPPIAAPVGSLMDGAVSSAQPDQHSITRSAGIVSLAVMGSRLLGLIREQVFAACFGAGFLNDAFQVGFRIPNTLRDLFAEGALSAAFVKTFTDYAEQKNEAEAWRLASMVMNALIIILSAVILLGVIFSPQIVALIAPGFAPEKARLAAALTRIMFPFMLMIALAAVAMGVLHTKGRFGVPASASTLFNVGSIIGGLAFAYWLSGGGWTSPTDPNAVPDAAAQRAITGMAIGTLIGGSLQFLIQVPSLVRVGFRFRAVVSFTDPGVRKIMRLMTPAIIGTASVQVNVLINTFFASQIEGGQSWLAYAFRLMQFPIGIFGVAIGTATLPAVARYAVRGDMTSFRATLSRSIRLIFLLTIPSACGLIVLGRPIIALIYERGAFTAADTEMVAWALGGYAIGLAGYAAIKVLSPAFYALDDARTPMLVSLASMAVNATASYVLMSLLSRSGVTGARPGGYGHVGLALSTSCVALINFLALACLMRRRIQRLEGRRIASSFMRVLLASVALSAASYGSYALLAVLLREHTLIARLVVALVPIIIGGAVFFMVARLLRISELSDAAGAIAGRFLPSRKQHLDPS